MQKLLFISTRLKMFEFLMALVMALGMACQSYADVALEDDFDDWPLDQAWEIGFQDADGWSYTESPTNLTVTDITPDVINPGGGGTWAIVTMSRDIEPIDEFSVDVEFSWDSSEDGVPASHNLRAMQCLYIELYDETGARIVLTGFADLWSGTSGAKYAKTNTETFSSGANSLPFSGSASINVFRCGNDVEVSWDGVSIASGTSEHSLKTIKINFYYYAADDGNTIVSHFGTESLDLVRITATGPGDWVSINSAITYDGTPLCALVLANGQYMFTCGNSLGLYDLYLPVDENCEITLYGFASGFAPFKTVLRPWEAFHFDINMTRAAAGSRELEVTVDSEPGTVNPNWVRISGTVTYNGEDVCAMVLANGQNMFSCRNDLGTFDLEVPLGSNGEITLYCFCSGFAPYKDVFIP